MIAQPERLLDQALAFAGHGWPVFPCQPGSKEPATRHGFRDATACANFRSAGGYVLAPPSHIGGTRYRLVERGAPAALGGLLEQPIAIEVLDET